jgi:hypothetical protein
MQIKQLNVTHNAEEDRLLLRISTTEEQEYCLWLTRTMVSKLWPCLNRCIRDLDTRRAGASDKPAAVQQVYGAFERDKNLQSLNLQQQYEPPKTQPLGDKPLLITSIDIASDGANTITLRWIERLTGVSTQRSFEMTLQPNMYHGLTTLLDKGMDAARWRDVSALTTDVDPAPALSEQPPQYLN